MKLSIFDAGPGDGFVVEGRAGGTVLVDGGKASDWRDHIRDRIPAFGDIDVVCISHIDSDHIGGIEQLLRDKWEWVLIRAHADPSLPEPKVPEPPEIGELWHNAFRDVVGENAGPIADLLAAVAPSLASTTAAKQLDVAHQMMNIATSVPEAMRVSQLRRLPKMDIGLNPPAAARLMTVESVPDEIEVGSLRFQLLSPTDKELADLRNGWNEWLEHTSNAGIPEAIRKEFRGLIDQFSSLSVSAFELASKHSWDKFNDVTVPNLASLTFHVTDVDDGRTLLLTGDHEDERLLGHLGQRGLLSDNGGIHVDVLKIPHHGSPNNASKEFCRRVTADHYVFCGNGGHHNPRPTVLDMYADARREGGGAVTTKAREKDRPFTFWFSTDSASVNGPASRRNFEEVEEKVARLQASGIPLNAEFGTDGMTPLDLAAVGQ